MAGWIMRTAALWVGTAAGCMAGTAIDGARRKGSLVVPAAPKPAAMIGAVSLASTAHGITGLDRRSPWLHLGIGFLTGLILTTFGDALVAAVDD